MKKLSVAVLAVTLFVMGCSDSGTVATVNGKDITQKEFNAYLKFKRVPEQDKERVARALDEYINRAAITAAIEKTDKLDESLTAAELEEFRREMIIGRYFEEYLNTAADDQAVRNYYSTNEKNYESQRVHAAHILIRVDANMSEAERQAKLTTAQAAYSQIQKGEDFALVAKKSSEDTVSAEKGGDLGWLNEGSVDPEFSKKLFSMKAGEVSEPLLTPFGYHLIKMIEGPQLVKRPLESVEGDIRYQLRNQAKLAETERLMGTVKTKRKD
jgi:peptidyl-prolyl cis-trans isomerase C